MTKSGGVSFGLATLIHFSICRVYSISKWRKRCASGCQSSI